MTKRINKFFVILFLSAACFRIASSQAPYSDQSHYSRVFGKEKQYRLYLPQGYSSQSPKKYPVIYFFHGWGGRHFKDDNALLEYEKISDLVDKYQIILVMWDGNIDLAEPRPYNIGNHEDVKFQVQMKDYFPELIAHIDSSYKTLTGRTHRGIIGFSMGGIMALYLGGKYPHLVSSVVSLAGSPEFFIGYPHNHTLYPVRYAFKNLGGVNVRIHNGDSDILYYLNEEVRKGADWEGVPIDYWKFHGGHMVDNRGETKVFESAINFITSHYSKNSGVPGRWTHYDLYNNFEVWGYTVTSNKQEPGYIALTNVDRTGFGVYAPRWLPSGPVNNHLKLKITTPPVYKANTRYQTVLLNKSNNRVTTNTVLSTNSGELIFQTGSSGYEIGIYEKEGAPSYVLADFKNSRGSKFLHVNVPNQLEIRLFNRGAASQSGSEVKLKLTTTDSLVFIENNEVEALAKNNSPFIEMPAITVVCKKIPPLHAEPFEVKFSLEITSEGQTWQDDFLMPVYFDVPYFENIKIDDGLMVRDTVLGEGNADGKPNAGERIMIYSGNHRLRLYTEDACILKEDETLADEMIPAIWPDGFTLSSVVHISEKCAKGKPIEFLARYETKTFNPIERKVTWGKVKITVE